jgi:hypothetical protein
MEWSVCSIISGNIPVSLNRLTETSLRFEVWSQDLPSTKQVLHSNRGGVCGKHECTSFSTLLKKSQLLTSPGVCLLKVRPALRDVLDRQYVIKFFTIVLIAFVENIKILGWASSSSTFSLRGTSLFITHTFSPSFPWSPWVSISFRFTLYNLFRYSVISQSIQIFHPGFVCAHLFHDVWIVFDFFSDIFILNTIQCSAVS